MVKLETNVIISNMPTDSQWSSLKSVVLRFCSLVGTQSRHDVLLRIVYVEVAPSQLHTQLETVPELKPLMLRETMVRS